ncbi:MAG TPA: transketolase C-terminal domain-containing protein, partial [Clostridia bacterium]|nr:transketolase C-terminal domain-containing protein [Clostridia bacterium]
VDFPGAVYLRFTRDPVETLYPAAPALSIGKAHRLRDGRDVAIIANGDTVAIAKAAAETLARQGVDAMVYDMHTIKPLDAQAVCHALEKTGRIITVEDHNIYNGLGSAVCEV